MTNAKRVAELRNVRFRYGKQPNDLLGDVNLEVRAGEVVILAGPNGMGKSTVLGLLSGRLSPTTGHVRVFGKDPASVSRAPGIGLVTEPFHPEQSPLPVDLSVREVFRWLQILDGVTDGAIEEGCNDLGLSPNLLDHAVRILSKGERQRVMLLVVLLRRPRLILADEPLEGLDRQTRRRIGESLHRFARHKGGTVLWVSHHLAETLQYADRFLEIEDGRILEERSARFEIGIRFAHGGTKSLEVCSLHALPSLVEEHLAGGSTLQLEIRGPEQPRIES